MVVCAGGSYMLVKAGNTLDNIAGNVKTTDTVSAYVMTDDPAQTLMDAKDYVFAITEKYDYEHTQKAIEKINETVGTQIRTQVYDNIPDMVQALYEGSADAMLMNVAYVDVVEAQDGYETFSSRQEHCMTMKKKMWLRKIHRRLKSPSQQTRLWFISVVRIPEILHLLPPAVMSIFWRLSTVHEAGASN